MQCTHPCVGGDEFIFYMCKIVQNTSQWKNCIMNSMHILVRRIICRMRSLVLSLVHRSVMIPVRWGLQDFNKKVYREVVTVLLKHPWQLNVSCYFTVFILKRINKHLSCLKFNNVFDKKHSHSFRVVIKISICWERCTETIFLVFAQCFLKIQWQVRLLWVE